MVQDDFDRETLSTFSCLLYNFRSAFMISSVGIVAYSCTYCGSEFSRLKPAVFMKKGCMTSGVASPSCFSVSLSITLCRGRYVRPAVLFVAGKPGDGARDAFSSTGPVVGAICMLGAALGGE